jgi:hypothetical protein
VVFRRWAKPVPNHLVGEPTATALQLPDTLTLTAPVSTADEMGVGPRLISFFQILIRPFTRFTFLWALLIILSIHKPVVEIALVVFLIHLLRTIFRMIKFSVFSQSWFGKIGQGIQKTIDIMVDKLGILNFESTPVQELKSLLMQIRFYQTVSQAIRNEPVYSRWLWVSCGVTVLSIQLYIAFLFSFAYVGMARIMEIGLTWWNAFVISLFIPIY